MHYDRGRNKIIRPESNAFGRANDLIQSIAGKCAEFANFTTGCLCFHNLVGIYYLAISILHPLFYMYPMMLLVRAVYEREYASTLLRKSKINYSDSDSFHCQCLIHWVSLH
jgi:hypothetical protein